MCRHLSENRIQEYTMDKYNIQKKDAIIIGKNIICGL